MTDQAEVRPLEPAIDAADYEAAARDVSARMLEIHASVDQNSLPHWVVYGDRTPKHPGFFAARLWLALPKAVPTNAVLRAGTLAEIRAFLPPGLTCMPRSPKDDPDIVETWM